MIRFRVFRSLALSMAALVVCACADDAPTLVAPNSGSSVSSTRTTTDVTATTDTTLTADTSITINGSRRSQVVKAVRWDPDRAKMELTKTATIGPAGGKISVPRADFTLIFNEGAVTVPTRITVIAKASPFVVYDFQPHGLVFAAPVYAVQDLKNTGIFGTSLSLSVFGAYISSDTDPAADGTTTAAETTFSSVYFNSKSGIAVQSVWLLKHFSRYMLASG
ncbi:MAG TPA: hypothetical protein VK494_07850 [Gemmatimonadaceae bacterium]|nr:hypothetical protein [Gemmatimonadaceae bacterium]